MLQEPKPEIIDDIYKNKLSNKRMSLGEINKLEKNLTKEEKRSKSGSEKNKVSHYPKIENKETIKENAEPKRRQGYMNIFSSNKKDDRHSSKILNENKKEDKDKKNENNQPKQLNFILQKFINFQKLLLIVSKFMKKY